MPHDREDWVKGRKIRLRVDMQVRPVRMKESRSVAPSSPRGLGYTKVLSSADAVQIASTPHDPSMRTVHYAAGIEPMVANSGI